MTLETVVYRPFRNSVPPRQLLYLFFILLFLDIYIHVSDCRFLLPLIHVLRFIRQSELGSRIPSLFRKYTREPVNVIINAT
jgi:hypothetical protein